MNFFEQELKKIFGNYPNVSFIGRKCYIPLDGDIKACFEFKTSWMADHYDSLSMKIINRHEGEVDKNSVLLKDVIGIKTSYSAYLKNGVSPYIWANNGNFEWYGFNPSAMDYNKLRECGNEYMAVFRPLEKEREHAISNEIMSSGETTWITVYKDSLGFPDDLDNLTEICVPSAWLMNQLKYDERFPEEWFNEYTADDTERIVHKAKAEGVILDYSDLNIKEAIMHRDLSLDSKIQSAEKRSGKLKSQPFPGKEAEH